MTAAARTGPRYPVLDALRAVAILLVLARHWAVASQAAFGVVPGGPLAVLAANGWIGVDLFFVLSGFLIGSHFTGPRAAPFERPPVLEFYRRRAFRTLPLYWGVILLCWMNVPFSSLSFVTHLLFLQDYLGSDVMVTLWSLAVEEKFYLATPALMFLLARAGPRGARMLLVLAMAALCWSMQADARGIAPGDYAAFFWSVRAPFHHAVLAILAGVLVAVQHGASGAWRAPRWLFLPLAALPLALLTWRDWLNLGDWPTVCWIIVLSSCLFALLVRCGLAINCRRGPAFGAARPWRHIARLSYALYLVHYPLIGPAMQACRCLLGGAQQAPVSGSLLFLAIYGAMAWAAAWLLHAALERPFLLLRDRTAPA